MEFHYLAIDLGAESGRVMLGTLASQRLALEEIHRFPNVPLKSAGELHWDLPRLFDGVKTGLRLAAARRVKFASVSCDTWGLDCVLLDAHGTVMPPVFHYRDTRTERGVKTLFEKVPWEKVFAETGIQFMAINALYHLAAESSERLARAAQIMPIGDVFNYLLCGVARAEVSIASTTQLYNPRTGAWSRVLLDALGIAAEKFPTIVSSGTRLGVLKSDLAHEIGLPQIEVLATCSHDTGAAVVAVPAETKSEISNLKFPAPDWAYLSSGTWSLLGVELPVPILSDACRECNFTNEIGYGGTVRLLKNIVGLWLVQECRRTWADTGQEYDYGTLTQLAAAAPPFVSLINPADPRFLSPGEMPEKIVAFCRETGQPTPANVGAFVRCVLESLALQYLRVLRQAEQLTGTRVTRIHIVGGGSQNELLNQFAANALQIPVLAGPIEATAIGNLLVQALTLGHLPSLVAAREVVRNSFALKAFTPCDASAWHAANERFLKL